MQHRLACRLKLRGLAFAAGALVLLPACEPSPASGAIDEIVVGTSGAVWRALEAEIVAALEPRRFTVRDERVFDVAFVPMSDRVWRRLRRMRQVLLIGSVREPLIAEALAAGDGEEYTRPVVIRVADVWAKNQVVTVALLPEDAEPGALRPLLPRIGEIFLERLDGEIRYRMAVVPRDDTMEEQLRRAGGFTLGVPYTYTGTQPEPGLFLLRGDQTNPVPVHRTIVVDSRARGAVEWSAEGARAWRAELGARMNRPPHVTEMLASAKRGSIAGQPTIRIQGVWSHPPGEWPSAGPFITRMVECGERVFLLDAWLYAPADDKYEHMVELDLVLDTFRCPGGPGGAERP